MTVDATCRHCGGTFEARRGGAKWCSDRCRKAAGRSATPQDLPADDHAPPTVPVDHGLVSSVRRELEDAGRVDTFAGQLALQLATRLANPDESGISSLSKELRTVMAAALDGVTPPADDDTDAQDSDAEPEDEVTRARRAREEARQAAGLA